MLKNFSKIIFRKNSRVLQSIHPQNKSIHLQFSCQSKFSETTTKSIPIEDQKHRKVVNVQTDTLMFTEINKSCCHGCGVKLQIIDSNEEGFIDYKIYSSYLKETFPEKEKNKSLVELEIEKYIQLYKDGIDEDLSKNPENVEPPSNPHSLENLETNFFQSFWKNKSTKFLYCFRCQKIKNHQFDDILNINTRLKCLIKSSPNI